MLVKSFLLRLNVVCPFACLFTSSWEEKKEGWEVCEIGICFSKPGGGALFYDILCGIVFAFSRSGNLFQYRTVFSLYKLNAPSGHSALNKKHLLQTSATLSKSINLQCCFKNHCRGSEGIHVLQTSVHTPQPQV